MDELDVVATIPVKPEVVDAIRSALHTLVAATRQEEGCISYDMYESKAVPGTFITIERWRGQSDLDAHLVSQHVADAFAVAEGKLSGDVAIHPLLPMA